MVAESVSRTFWAVLRRSADPADDEGSRLALLVAHGGDAPPPRLLIPIPADDGDDLYELEDATHWPVVATYMWICATRGVPALGGHDGVTGSGEDDELLGCSGHRDVAIDRPFDAGTERLRFDQYDQVELEAL